MRKLLKVEFWLLGAVFVVVVAPLACQKKDPILIGYAANLSGRISELGRTGFNGVQLAIEEVNRRGGIHGHTVKLLTRDNRGDAARAAEGTRELVDAGCAVIIGHMLSSMSVAAVPALAGSDTVMLSPTTSTSELSGRDDQFLRIYPDLRQIAERLARHIFRERGLRRMAIVGDSANRAFSEPWMASFTRYFEAEGGQVVSRAMFSSLGQEALYNTVAEALVPGPDGLLIIASAPDTGIICQQLSKLGRPIPVFTSEWSFAGDLLRYGGQSVDGLTLFHSFDIDSSAPAYREFSRAYRAVYDKPPGFAAVNAYDATGLALKALLEQRTGESLKQALLRQGAYHGLQVEMRLDSNGDIERPLFLTRIDGGHFQRVGAP